MPSMQRDRKQCKQWSMTKLRAMGWFPLDSREPHRFLYDLCYPCMSHFNPTTTILTLYPSNPNPNPYPLPKDHPIHIVCTEIY